MSFDLSGTEQVDVLIVGAGPAGAVAALVLARRGFSVAVIDRKPQDSIKVGECLPPKALDTLKMLGLEQAFLKDEHFDMQGYQVNWDGHGSYERNFMATPHGTGWLLNRERFDAMLTAHAEQAGVRFFWQTSLKALEQQADGTWQATSDKHRWRAKAVIDATGRARTVAHKMGANSRRLDNLLACITRVEHHPGCPLPPRDVLIHSDENGWWYTAPYTEQYSTLCYFTDSDLPQPKSAKQLHAKALNHPLLNTRLDQGYVATDEPMQRVNAWSSALDRCVGHNWLAVGDAACSFDPLSSYGITSAMGSAFYGAIALAETLETGQSTLPAYQQLVQQTFLEFLSIRDEEYAKVQHFDEPFWQRRNPLVTS